MVEDAFYTTEELAKLLKVSTRTVQRWLAQRKLAHHVVLGQQRIPGSVIDKLLTESLKPRKVRIKLQQRHQRQ